MCAEPSVTQFINEISRASGLLKEIRNADARSNVGILQNSDISPTSIEIYALVYVITFLYYIISLVEIFLATIISKALRARATVARRAGHWRFRARDPRPFRARVITKNESADRSASRIKTRHARRRATRLRRTIPGP